MMNRYDYLITIILVSWLALIGATVYVDHSYIKLCHDAGGQPVIGNKGSLCINPSAIIEVE